MRGMCGPILRRLQSEFRQIAPLAGTDVTYSVNERLQYHKCPSLSLALLQEGQICETAAFGFANVREAREVNTETLFQAASLSKPIAAILALQLVEQGLDLDAPVKDYLSVWKMPPEFENIPFSLRHLLSHRSGATTVRFLSLDPESEVPTTMDILTGRSPAINDPLAFSSVPGASECYSNTGYILVQQIIEEITGMPFDIVAKERLFDRLELKRSTFAQPLPSDLRSNAAVGYERGEPMNGLWRFQPQLAAAGLWTTPTEYAQLLLAFRGALTESDNRLFKRSTAHRMIVSEGGGFGLGWMLWGEGERLRIGHTGSNQGYRSFASISLNRGDGLIAMSNADTGRAVYMEALHGLAEICDWPDLKGVPWSKLPLSVAKASSFEGNFNFVGGAAPPFSLTSKAECIERSSVDGRRAVEKFYLGKDMRLYCPDSIFSLEASASAGGRVTGLTVYEFERGEVARAVRTDSEID